MPHRYELQLKWCNYLDASGPSWSSHYCPFKIIWSNWSTPSSAVVELCHGTSHRTVFSSISDYITKIWFRILLCTSNTIYSCNGMNSFPYGPRSVPFINWEESALLTVYHLEHKSPTSEAPRVITIGTVYYLQKCLVQRYRFLDHL